jgi:hypothetical protein
VVEVRTLAYMEPGVSYDIQLELPANFFDCVESAGSDSRARRECVDTLP